MPLLPPSIEEIVRLQQKGLITIPKKMRDELNIDENDFLRLKKEKGKIIIEPVRTLPYPIRSYSAKEIDEFIAFDKEETKTLRKKKLI